MAALVLVSAVAGCRQGKAEWFDGSMKAAQQEAGKRQTVLVVSITAEWCPACHELERRFWNTRHGLRAGERYVLKLVDFDGIEGQKMVARYNVISIPTTIVLDSKGHELGRIVGFEKPRPFKDLLAHLSESTGDRGLQELETRHVKRPDDLQVALELGEALLTAGMQSQGMDVLEGVLEKDPKNKAGAFMDATRLLGRYFVRCRQDHFKGRDYFQAAVDRFPDAEEVWEFRYWIGQAIWKSGSEDEALEYFAKLAEDHGDVADAHAIRARFLQLTCTDYEAALEAIGRAMEIEPDDDWSCFVKAEVLRKLGRKDEAMASLERAIELAPEKKAIYLDRQEQWSEK
jgi:thioredoxin-like negative regulator of GroEL